MEVEEHGRGARTAEVRRRRGKYGRMWRSTVGQGGAAEHGEEQLRRLRHGVAEEGNGYGGTRGCGCRRRRHDGARAAEEEQRVRRRGSTAGGDTAAPERMWSSGRRRGVAKHRARPCMNGGGGDGLKREMKKNRSGRTVKRAQIRFSHDDQTRWSTDRMRWSSVRSESSNLLA
jgi:hypothetical protein